MEEKAKSSGSDDDRNASPEFVGFSVMEALGLSRAKRTANHFRSSADGL